MWGDYNPVTSALKRQRFKASLGYIGKAYLNTHPPSPQNRKEFRKREREENRHNVHIRRNLLKEFRRENGIKLIYGHGPTV
jgi:hypothetical protein